MRTALEGQRLGRYQVLEPLGRGGMARVYRAYHPQLDRYVAIKVLRPDLVDDDEFLARFQREARAVAALRHPHIIQVFDFDVQDGTSFMVMELLEGDTLRARLNDYRLRGEPMPRGEVLRVLLDVLDGLGYAHEAGMIHRDIKPANIMLTRRGETVLTDFGIAQIIGATRHTAAGALMGTLNYVAPEQGLEGRSDPRSDLYSVGIVAYEMLTQRIPFDADTPLAILMKHLNDPLPLPRQVDPTIPESLERVLLKTLAKNPDDRYQSAAELAQALRQAAAAAGIEIPERISLPLSFTTAADPSEPVAVFSGTARERITDRHFAADETDATLGERLTMERTVTLTTPTATATATAPATPLPGKAEPAGRQNISTGAVILGVLGAALTCNLLAIMGSGLTRHSFFAYGWPVELLFVGLLLCAVMWASGSIWLVIPVGIVLGNGVLLSFYALTGWWSAWSFLWPLEPLLVLGSFVLPFWLRNRPQLTRLSQTLALLAGAVTAVLIWIISVLATLR